MRTKHLSPALSPFCSADSAKRGEGETFPTFAGITSSAICCRGQDFLVEAPTPCREVGAPQTRLVHHFNRLHALVPFAQVRQRLRDLIVP